MILNTRRFIDEFVLYSSQFTVFFILMLFITPSADTLNPISMILVLSFLIIQIILLIKQGQIPLLRILYSLITPLGYTLMRIIGGYFSLSDMASIFIWTAAIYVGLFQAIALSFRKTWIREAAEAMLALGSVLVFISFYFYLNLRSSLVQQLTTASITMEQYSKALEIGNLPTALYAFFSNINNGFLIFGTSTFSIMLLVNKVQNIKLRSRISRLFEAVRLDEKALATEEKIRRNPSQEMTITVISSDIRDFSKLSHELGAERSIAILNRYYSLWEASSQKSGGRVLNITGDSVLIVFGVSGDGPNAEAALACAENFIAELPDLQDDLQSSSLPYPEGVNIGMHSGTIIAGFLGLPESRTLHVIGDAVSVATRLDSLCREFRQPLILSQTVFRQLSLESQENLVRIGEVFLRNSTQALPVYGKK